MDDLLAIKKFLEIAVAILLTLGILFSLVGSARAKANRAASGRNVSAAPSPPQGLTDPAGLETFLDELLGKEMEENHIAGAAISVNPTTSTSRNIS